MAHDDSVQIAATSPATAQSSAYGDASERRAPVDARRRRRSPNAGPAKRGVGVTTEAKFSGLQSLENSNNGESISIFREPAPHRRNAPHG
jgi:hypothetical protein